MKLVENAPAKINLTLRVMERLESGYHRIETLMLKTSVVDELKMEISEGSGVSVHVPGFPDLSNERNLAHRAACLFMDKIGARRKVEIFIQKKIPVAGGLGGGSSNAAAALRAMAKILPLPSADLYSLAASLGSDVPFLLHPCALGLGVGRGDEIQEWKAPPSLPLLLVNPGLAVSTADVYKALNRPLTWNQSDDISLAARKNAKNWSDLKELLKLGNDLQKVAEKMHPEIRQIRMALKNAGAFFSQMSGSGSTVFALFEDMKKAKKASQELQSQWRVILGQTLSDTE